MAINTKLIKIHLTGLDTKGLYYKSINNIFTKKEIGKNELKKIDYENIAIVVKLYFQDRQIKKTLKFNNITGLQAVKKAVARRVELKEILERDGEFEKKIFFSLNDLFIDYIENKTKSLSKRYIYSTKKTYDKWIKNRIGKKNIRDITKQDIQRIVNLILQQGMAPRTALSIKQILRPLYKEAIEANLVQINMATKIEIPSFDNTMHFELEDDKRIELYNKILEYEPIKYRGIMLFIYFGRRLNEALTLSWNNINFKKQTYIIEAQHSKIRRRQEYPLLEPLRKFLGEYQSDNFQYQDYIFKGMKTEHVTKSTFRSHWKKLLKNAKIETMRIHDTRHLIGNTLVNRGESLENIGKVLGHSSTEVTKRYADTTIATADRLLNEYLK